jgi:hypothetical protein
MDSIRLNLNDEVAMLRSTFITRGGAIDAQLKALNPTDLATVEAKFGASAAAAVAAGAVGRNEIIASAITSVRNEIAQAVSALGKVQLFISLATPQIEDGGNFGVAVQGDVLKVISDLKGQLKGVVKDYTEYYKERSAAAEKVSVASLPTTKKSTTTTKTDDSKTADGETKVESKESVTVTSTEDASAKPAASVLPDAVSHLVSIDTNMHFTLVGHLEALLASYLIVADVFDKNEAKVLAPRGGAGGGNPMTMY